jgi:hypothetical protein
VQYTAFEFRVIGAGDPRPWTVLAERLSLDGLVRFCGTLPTGRPVFEWLDEIDVYLQPSLQEGLCTAPPLASCG